MLTLLSCKFRNVIDAAEIHITLGSFYRDFQKVKCKGEDCQTRTSIIKIEKVG